MPGAGANRIVIWGSPRDSHSVGSWVATLKTTRYQWPARHTTLYDLRVSFWCCGVHEMRSPPPTWPFFVMAVCAIPRHVTS